MHWTALCCGPAEGMLKACSARKTCSSRCCHELQPHKVGKLQSLEGLADSGTPAFVQRQRLLALCGWETRVMPFAIGKAPAPAGAGVSASGGDYSTQQPADLIGNNTMHGAELQGQQVSNFHRIC